jgi:hypothetical protein
MEFESFIIFGLACAGLYFFYSGKWKKGRGQSYGDLLMEKERLKKVALHWRYCNGAYVPQNRRGDVFTELRSVSRRLRKHPDNPENKYGRAV